MHPRTRVETVGLRSRRFCMMIVVGEEVPSRLVRGGHLMVSGDDGGSGLLTR